MRTERQKRAFDEVKKMRLGMDVYHSPYSFEATHAGYTHWWQKIYRGYSEAFWPCSPWWREYIRCIVRIYTAHARTAETFSLPRSSYTLVAKKIKAKLVVHLTNN